MSVEAASELRFEPPGPGSWELDPVHFPRPVTHYWVEIHPAPFTRGFNEFMATTARCSTRSITGTSTALPTRLVPVADERDPAAVPAGGSGVGQKLWRDQLREWDETFKPAVDRRRTASSSPSTPTRSPMQN